MQISYPYRALKAFGPPGTAVNGYQRGDGVPQDVVDNWELEVGIDVEPTDTAVIGYPGEGADRKDWEAWAIGQGMPADEARAASLDDLIAAYPEPEPDADGNLPPGEPLADSTARPERPDETALKAAWIAYVTASGADKTWANEKATTKADLMAWDPGQGFQRPVVGDTIAASLSEQQNDG